MTHSFQIRCRKTGTSKEASQGDVLELEEQTEYVITLSSPYTKDFESRIVSLGGSMYGETIASLNFRNFVGRANLLGVTLDVRSRKLGPGGASALLQEVSDLASGLVFGWGSPTSFSTSPGLEARPPVPYHQLQLLRHVMLEERPGNRLQDWLAAIERAPTRRYLQERPLVSPDRVQSLDPQALVDIFANPDRLVPAPPGSPGWSTPLAQALTFGNPSRRHFPASVAAPQGQLSTDTPENRFVRHVVSECLALTNRFLDHRSIHADLRTACRQMGVLLHEALGRPLMAGVGRLSSLQSPSQALLKGEGYRELYGFWSDLRRYRSLPLTSEETTRLLEGRDVATLYEYWVFLKVFKAVRQVAGSLAVTPIRAERTELGESLVAGLEAKFGKIRLRYNASFTRSSGGAYSTPLRPDVVLEFGEQRHAFDAKYRLDWLDTDEKDPDDGTATYKRADLYKMHAYRDAIHGLRTAFVVYPGSEFVFFSRDGGKCASPSLVSVMDGVGAVPLRPASTAADGPLTDLIAILLNQPGAACPSSP
ncbi:DUF2357 domain-containing protein [Salinarimonas soli]|uniref:DUF2357 domain-containing protein n=1 Tax=Salinarimonas soli TaxID=1638099 RepID=A0A5B2V9I9_9HYPH|nr:DUF2357 domain-containing protein [Salinarimonas soli]KAA2234907.1 DUF2357 domain-containing protein [Salinarimonas soli]